MVLSLTRSLPIVQPASESRHLIDTTTGQVADCGSLGCRQFDLTSREDRVFLERSLQQASSF